MAGLREAGVNANREFLDMHNSPQGSEKRRWRGRRRNRKVGGRERGKENEQYVLGSVSVYSEEVIRELSLVPVRHHSR